MRRAWIAALLLAAAAPWPAAAQTRVADAPFTALYARFTEAYRKADPAMVAALYTEDAYYLQPSTDILAGRPAVLGVFDRFLTPMAQRAEAGPAIYFEILERVVDGGHGWDVGYYRMGPPGADSATAKRAGKFIVLWRKDRDGQWRIRADGYSGLGQPSP